MRLGYLRVLSILIFIAWPDLRLFRPRFMHDELDDSKLFLDDKQVETIGSSALIFQSQQYIFKPEMIVQRHEDIIQKVDANCRLPFTDAPEYLGHGGFGAVTKRTTAPRCFVEISPSGEKSLNLEVRLPSHEIIHFANPSRIRLLLARSLQPFSRTSLLTPKLRD